MNIKKLLICCSIFLGTTSLVQANPPHLPGIYGNGTTNTNKGWIAKLYDDSSTAHNYLASFNLCFGYVGTTGTHTHGIVYVGTNWAGRWSQEGDQVRIQMQRVYTDPLLPSAVIEQDAIALELVTQVGTTTTLTANGVYAKLNQMSFGHWDHWGSSAAPFGNKRRVFNVVLEEMPAINSQKICPSLAPQLFTAPADQNLIEQSYV